MTFQRVLPAVPKIRKWNRKVFIEMGIVVGEKPFVHVYNIAAGVLLIQFY